MRIQQRDSAPATAGAFNLWKLNAPGLRKAARRWIRHSSAGVDDVLQDTFEWLLKRAEAGPLPSGRQLYGQLRNECRRENRVFSRYAPPDSVSPEEVATHWSQSPDRVAISRIELRVILTRPGGEFATQYAMWGADKSAYASGITLAAARKRAFDFRRQLCQLDRP